jgi:hypothetical protein
VGDANANDTYQTILKIAPEFDLIIDDGSHRSGDVVRSFSRYFTHLRDGGMYVVEDLHCSYWEGWQGGLHLPYSSMAFFKKLADTINQEHWGTGDTRCEFLQNFSLVYKTEFDESILTHIHSIEFINSMCVIRKAKPANNILGARLLGGTIPLVDDVALNEPSKTNIVKDADANSLHSIVVTDEELFLDAEKMRADLRAVYASRSWRWTKPLRSLLTRFR